MPHRTPFAPLLATLLLSVLVSNANAATASPAQPATVAAQSAAADKVYPPLPSLALLPPPGSSDDEPQLSPNLGPSRKKHGRAFVRVRQAAPAVKFIVTDTSRAYLRGVEEQLDAALAK